MKIEAYTALIHVESGQYPVYLTGVRRNNPNVSFPNNPTVDQLSEHGYAVVKHTEAPVAEVVVEGKPELVEGEYLQTWIGREFNEEERLNHLTQLKTQLVDEIAQLRARELEHGFDYTASDDTVIGVQLRDEDKPNLIVLRDEADAYIDAGSEEQMEFRCRDNLTHMLDPLEMSTMCLAALQHFKAVLKATWVLKDQVKDAKTAAELPTIPTSLV